jgi:glycopeptide antibiotics resistance protein
VSALRIALLMNFICLSYFVWTPVSKINCENNPFALENAFCLGPWLNFLGNLMLLAPTALLVMLLFPKWSAPRVVMISISLATIIESVQNFIPGRDPSWMDFVLNSLGATVLALIMAIVRQQPLEGQ